MRLFQAIQRLWHSDNIDEIAQQAAKRSQAEVWQRVQGRLASMDVDEARGYVRSRAALLVARELAENPLCQRLSDHQQHKVKQVALEIVIDSALVQKQSLVIQPVVVRRAA